MLWELYQFSRIHRAQLDASHALSSAHRATSDLGSMQRTLTGLEQQVERLTMATIAMIEIMRDRHGVSEQEFEAKVREIDMRDGRMDGKLQQQARSPQSCPSCGRLNAPTRVACLYCGAAIPGDPSLTVGRTP